jgi:hypothetical protein
VTDTVVPTFTLPVIVILDEPNDTGSGLEKLIGVFPVLSVTKPVEPIPTGNLLTSVTDEPALITIISAGCGNGLYDILLN